MAHPLLTAELASRFARLALAHVRREYPNKLQHVLSSAEDVRGPRELHPIFHGSFDWHSCVHGYWLLATLLHRFPEIPEASQVESLFDEQLTAEHVAGELRYLDHPLRGTFERPYGWGWLLKLHLAMAALHHRDGARWPETLTPLTAAYVDRFKSFLPRADYPVRVGTHFNTAFALRCALEYASATGDETLALACREAALRWYADDADCQAWEPGGDDFLSSALIEAECMRWVLDRAEFTAWMDRFLPRVESRRPASLFTPAVVSDRTDGKIAHLDGLNLSRAWCWRSLASAWPDADARHGVAMESADAHLAAALPHVSGDYMGEHWLATFALLALIA